MIIERFLLWLSGIFHWIVRKRISNERVKIELLAEDLRKKEEEARRGR